MGPTTDTRLGFFPDKRDARYLLWQSSQRADRREIGQRDRQATVLYPHNDGSRTRWVTAQVPRTGPGTKAKREQLEATLRYLNGQGDDVIAWIHGTLAVRDPSTPLRLRARNPPPLPVVLPPHVAVAHAVAANPARCFSWAFLRSGSIVVPIAFHATGNVVAAVTNIVAGHALGFPVLDALSSWRFRP